MDNLQIRVGNISDLDELVRIETASYPVEEMANKERIQERLSVYGDRFWIMENNGIMVAFINGMISNERNLLDEMFSSASMHNPDGVWQMIFSVTTHPDYRKRGYAKMLLQHVIEQVKKEGRKGLVLTCKEHLLSMYGSVGFIDEGVSESEHGGAVWHQMRITF